MAMVYHGYRLPPIPGISKGLKVSFFLPHFEILHCQWWFFGGLPFYSPLRMCKDTGLAMALYQVPPSSRGQSPQIMEIGMIFEQIDCFNDFFSFRIFWRWTHIFQRGWNHQLDDFELFWNDLGFAQNDSFGFMVLNDFGMIYCYILDVLDRICPWLNCCTWTRHDTFKICVCGVGISSQSGSNLLINNDLPGTLNNRF